MNVTPYAANLETIQRAANNNDLAVLDCTDSRTGEHKPILIALYIDSQGMINLVPLAEMLQDNPYDYLIPPDPDEPDQTTPYHTDDCWYEYSQGERAES